MQAQEFKMHRELNNFGIDVNAPHGPREAPKGGQ
jgi:hypothetical protein